jgi:hypothetical protein
MFHIQSKFQISILFIILYTKEKNMQLDSRHKMLIIGKKKIIFEHNHLNNYLEL